MRNLYRDFETQAHIDAQYNPSLALAPDDDPMRHFADQAMRARATLCCRLDQHYGPTLAETLDIFPARQPNAPVFIFIHGGYWRALSSKDFSGVALGLQPLGITTVVINYALRPFVSIDEITLFYGPPDTYPAVGYPGSHGKQRVRPPVAGLPPSVASDWQPRFASGNPRGRPLQCDSRP